MIVVIVIGLLIALVIALVIGVAKDPGPSATEVALGFEHAWDELDFDVIYRMSGFELHEGRTKAEFIAAQRAAHAGGAGRAHVVEQSAAEAEHREGDAAVVTTRLTLRDGTVVRHEVGLVRRARAWEVVAYELRPTPAA